MQGARLFRELGEDGRNAARGVDVLHVPLAIAVPRGRDLREMRRPLGHLVESGEWVFDLGFAREREDVQHRVRRSAHGDVERDGVVDGVGGDDVAEIHVLAHAAHEVLRSETREVVARG